MSSASGQRAEIAPDGFKGGASCRQTLASLRQLKRSSEVLRGSGARHVLGEQAQSGIDLGPPGILGLTAGHSLRERHQRCAYRLGFVCTLGPLAEVPHPWWLLFPHALVVAHVLVPFHVAKIERAASGGEASKSSRSATGRGLIAAPSRP